MAAALAASGSLGLAVATGERPYPLNLRRYAKRGAGSIAGKPHEHKRANYRRRCQLAAATFNRADRAALAA